MFTRNWYKALAATATQTSGKDTYTAIDGVTTNLVTNNEYYIQYGRDNEYKQCPSIYRMRTTYSGTFGGVILGTGTKPPSINDCKLSGDLVSGYIYSSTVQTIVDDYGTTTTALYTITNTSDKTITIGEIGLMAVLNSGSANAQTFALLERTALEVPLVIEPEGVGQLTYTIRFNHPTS